MYGNLYSAYLKDGDDYIMNLVPAEWCGGTTVYSKNGTVQEGYLEEGTVGLLDEISKIFYINSGQGSFAAGEATDPSTDGKTVTETTTVDYPANHVLIATWKPAALTLNMNYEGNEEQTVIPK